MVQHTPKMMEFTIHPIIMSKEDVEAIKVIKDDNCIY